MTDAVQFKGDGMTATNNRLVWVDLEMTGLNPAHCTIVEMAMIITDRELNTIGKPLELVVWQPDSVLEKMEPLVRHMHQSSNLIELIRQSEISLEQAEQKALAFLSEHCTYRSAPLCGNTIGQDRLFMRHYMPHFENALHYRNLDVSSVKMLSSWWFKKNYDKPGDGQHRAMHDIEQSIAELKYYKENIFA